MVSNHISAKDGVRAKLLRVVLQCLPIVSYPLVCVLFLRLRRKNHHLSAPDMDLLVNNAGISYFKAREEERIQLARELHNGPMQTLYLMGIYLKGMNESDRVNNKRDYVSAIQEAQRNIIDELRGICRSLRTSCEETPSIETALRAYIEYIQKLQPGLTVQLHVVQRGQIATASLKQLLVQICQESLNNIVKHAHASQVHIQLIVKERFIQLNIRDNGCGFVVPESLTALEEQGHLGLIGIAELLNIAQGSLDIVSSPGKGTQIYMSIPNSYPERPKTLSLSTSSPLRNPFCTSRRGTNHRGCTDIALL